jgi:cytochrome c oxidase cbb3-type subunit I/II
MPGYPWLFDGSPTQPRSEAHDLVDYLDSLGRDARLAGLSDPEPLPGRDPEEERRKGMFCDCSIPRTAGKAPVWNNGLAVGEAERFARRGAEVFARDCAGCHGPAGRGDGPAAVALIPAPRNLTVARFSERRLSESLWNGVRGSSMPSWNDLSAGDLRGLVAFLGTIASSEPESELKAEERLMAQDLFTKQCAVCHGPDGRGDGLSSSLLAPRPTDFHEVRPTTAYAESVLAHGVRGTAMPRWTGKLTPDQQKLLARYVRSFFGKE